MTQRVLGVAAAVVTVDAALLIVVGSTMWEGEVSAADVAVGKGLVALGAALAIAAIALGLSWIDAWVTAPGAAPEPVRNDWEDA